MKPAKRRAIRQAALRSVTDHEPMAMTTKYHRLCQHCGRPTLLPSAHFDTCPGVALLRSAATTAARSKSAAAPRLASTPSFQAEAARVRVVSR